MSFKEFLGTVVLMVSSMFTGILLDAYVFGGEISNYCLSTVLPWTRSLELPDSAVLYGFLDRPLPVLIVTFVLACCLLAMCGYGLIIAKKTWQSILYTAAAVVSLGIIAVTCYLGYLQMVPTATQVIVDSVPEVTPTVFVTSTPVPSFTPTQTPIIMSTPVPSFTPTPVDAAVEVVFWRDANNNGSLDAGVDEPGIDLGVVELRGEAGNVIVVSKGQKVVVPNGSYEVYAGGKMVSTFTRKSGDGVIFPLLSQHGAVYTEGIWKRW